MDAQTINQTFDLLSLVVSETTLKKVGSYYVGPCPFCSGKDRFTLKTTLDGYRWYCRGCGDGKFHTSIDYIMARDVIDFKDALVVMSEENVKLIHSSDRPKREPTQAFPVLPDSTWQAEAFRLIDESSERLLGSPEGQAGRDYLSRRGLHYGTWQAHLLGFRNVYDPSAKRKRPAISIPWWDCNAGREVVTAIKYRFVDKDSKGLRYIAHKGSAFVLYGLWNVLSHYDTLLFVEGEINALSIWQCLPSKVDCLSFGSESGGSPEISRTLAAHYQNVFIWVDAPGKAIEICRMVGRSAQALQSPLHEGVKWDANELLKAGSLPDFLSCLLGVVCLGQD